MDILVLHNRSAGDEEPAPGRLLALLRRGGYTPHYFDLHAALETPSKLPDADFIVVAGGDGSFRRAVLTLGQRHVPFALLPVGTANNIARTLGISGSAPDVISEWDRSERVRFDVGLVKGPWGERKFVEGVGVGLFARVIEILSKVEEGEHADAARPHRVASDLRSTTVLAHEIAPLAVEAVVDGERVAGDYLVFEVLNIARVGAGVSLVDADIGDGSFDLITAESDERPLLLETLGNVARGMVNPSKLPARQGRKIELLLPPCALRVDDEVIPLTEATRIEISMLPEGVQVMRPERAE